MECGDSYPPLAALAHRGEAFERDMQRGWEMADDTKTDEATRPTEVDRAQAPPPAGDLVPVHQEGGLLVPRTTALYAPKKTPKKNWWLRIAVMVAALAGAGSGGYYWWQHVRSQIPPGIAYGNGRLEADAINIDTKYAGRIAELFTGRRRSG